MISLDKLLSMNEYERAEYFYNEFMKNNKIDPIYEKMTNKDLWPLIHARNTLKLEWSKMGKSNFTI